MKDFKDKLTLAYGYGVSAFMNRKPRKPFLDNLVMALSTGEVNLQNAKIYKAWLAGWDNCNANALVKDYAKN